MIVSSYIVYIIKVVSFKYVFINFGGKISEEQTNKNVFFKVATHTHFYLDLAIIEREDLEKKKAKMIYWQLQNGICTIKVFFEVNVYKFLAHVIKIKTRKSSTCTERRLLCQFKFEGGNLRS